MISLIRFVFFKFVLRIAWIGLLATFGIQLLLTFLPPKRAVDPRSTFQEKMIEQSWTTERYINWAKLLVSATPQISDENSGNWLVQEFKSRAWNTLTLCWNAFIAASVMGIFIGTAKATLNNETVSGPKTSFRNFFSSLSTASLFVLSSPVASG